LRSQYQHVRNLLWEGSLWIGILLLQFVCVCVSVSVSVSEVWHLSEMLNAGFDHLLHNVLNENWFPLIVVESSFLDSKRYNLKEHLLHLISHIMIKTCADDEIQIYIIFL